MRLIQSIYSRGGFGADTTFASAEFATMQGEIFEAATTGRVDLLASLIDESFFDLTTLDGSTRETLLHRALSSDQDDVVLMLLDRAGDDPLILNAKDKDGYTPLMRAAAQNNVPMMQALVRHGARSDDSVEIPELNQDSDAWLEMSSEKPQIVPGTRDFLSVMVFAARRGYGEQLSGRLKKTVDANVLATTAQMLVDAQGDLHRAFELAVERKSAYAAKFYFDAGRNAVPLTRDHAVRYTSSYEVLAALLWIQQLGNQREVEAEATSYELVSRLLRDHMGGLSDRVKIAVLKRIVDATGAAASKLAYMAERECRWPTRTWTEDACDTYHFDHLRLLIAAGVRCDPLLLDIFKSAPLAVLQKIGTFKIDCHTMMALVRECIDDADVSQKIAALLPGVLKGLFEDDRLSDPEKLAALRELPLEHGRFAVEPIMLDLVKNERSLTPARLLIKAGASTIDVLGELAKAKNRNALLKFIRMGANPFAAMEELVKRGEQEAARQLVVAVALEYAQAGTGNPGRPYEEMQAPNL